MGGQIARPGEGVDRSPLPLCDLGHDVTRSAKAVDPERLAFAGHRQRAPTDQAGAEQGGERDITALLAEWEGEVRIDDRRRREAAVTRVAGEQRMVTEVFPVIQAIGADTAGVTKPGNADALAGPQPFDARPDQVDPPDDLVPRNNRRHRGGQFAIDDVQVGAADAAGADLHANLTWPRSPIGQLRPFERRTEFFQNHRVHPVAHDWSSGASSFGLPMKLSQTSLGLDDHFQGLGLGGVTEGPVGLKDVAQLEAVGDQELGIDLAGP